MTIADSDTPRRPTTGVRPGLHGGRAGLARLSLAVTALAALSVAGGLLLPAATPAPGWGRFGVAVAVFAGAQFVRLRCRVGSGVINVGWGEAAVIVGLYLVPAAWLPAALLPGVLVGVAGHILAADRRPFVDLAYVVGSLTLGGAAAAGVALAAGQPYGQPFTPAAAAVLGVAALAYFAVTSVLVASALALRHGQAWRPSWRGAAGVQLPIFVGNVLLGLVTILLIEVDPRWLLGLPPVLWLLRQTYAQRLHSGDERTTWEAFAGATRALNQLDEREVAVAGVRGALSLFAAESAEVEIRRADGEVRVIRGDAAGTVTDSDPQPDLDLPAHPAVPASAPVRAVAEGLSRVAWPVVDGEVAPGQTAADGDAPAGGDAVAGGDGDGVSGVGGGAVAEVVTVPAELPARRELIVGDVRVGELRVWFPRGGVPGARNEAALSAFGDALGAALHDAATHRELRTLAARSAYDAVHDPLTGLLNRVALLTRGDHRLSVLERGAPVVLMLLDVDHFKEVNDTLGHAAGDELLQVTGERLAGLIGPDDLLARLGGDEFALLLTGVSAEPGAPDTRRAAAPAVLRRARALAASLAAPVEVAGVRVSVEVSIGVVVAAAESADTTELLRRADIALYRAKDGGSKVALYDSAQDDGSIDQLALLAELREALAEGEQLVLAMQPAVDLSSGAPTGVEALIRWRHPRRGLLKPGEFIRAVEKSELLAPFTRYVLDRALAVAARWVLDVPIAVNVSARNLLDPSLPADVAELLRRHGVAPHRLVLEITETVVMSELEMVDEVLAGLRELGVQLAVDDFGTGYSSLTFLTRITVDELKVDRAFVARMTESPEAAAIVRTTVDLGRELGLRVVAEGVETAAQRAALAALGCPAAQGFHFFRPMPAEKIDGVLTSMAEGSGATVLPLRADGAS